MQGAVTVRDKETGEFLEDGSFEVRTHGANYKALVSWRAIEKIGFADSADVAVQNAFRNLEGLDVLRNYDLKLVPSGK